MLRHPNIVHYQEEQEGRGDREGAGRVLFLYGAIGLLFVYAFVRVVFAHDMQPDLGGTHEEWPVVSLNKNECE